MDMSSSCIRLVKPDINLKGEYLDMVGEWKQSVEFLHVPSSRNAIGFYEKMGFVKNEVQNDMEDEITWMSMEIK